MIKLTVVFQKCLSHAVSDVLYGGVLSVQNIFTVMICTYDDISLALISLVSTVVCCEMPGLLLDV